MVVNFGVVVSKVTVRPDEGEVVGDRTVAVVLVGRCLGGRVVAVVEVGGGVVVDVVVVTHGPRWAMSRCDSWHLPCEKKHLLTEVSDCRKEG